MKILVVGLGRKKQHEASLVSAFARRGVISESFTYGHRLYGFTGYINERFLVGNEVRKINRDLINRSDDIKPDVVFLYRATIIEPRTIDYLLNNKIKVIFFNPDSIFGENGKKLYWRNYKNSIEKFTINYVYREIDKVDIEKSGVNNTKVLMSYYVPDLTFVNKPKEFSVKDFDVGFYGHAEPDCRVNIVRSILENGYKVNISGRDWNKYGKELIHDGLVESLGSGYSIENYVKEINNTKLCLSFYSTWNRDDYTRRVFEIPACGSILVSPRTKTLEKIYNEEEALFYSGIDELLEKIEHILSDQSAWNKIHSAGRKRLISSGYDIDTRVAQILEDLHSI